MKSVLIVSYFGNHPSLVMSQWVLDKIYAFNKLNLKVYLITSYREKKIVNKMVSHFRIPSLGPKQFFNEIKISGKFTVLHLFMLPITLTFGIIFEAAERIILKRIGNGFWSWTPTSLIAIMTVRLLLRPSYYLSTGGPASSHLALILSNILSRKEIMFELQDPLQGEDIGHNLISSNFLQKLESLIIKKAYKVVFVTHNSLKAAKSRINSNNLYYSYTSSRIFNNENITDSYFGENLSIVHFGTLYSTRNFGNLIEALTLSKNFNSSSQKITNFGHISDDCKTNNSFITVVENEAVRRDLAVSLMSQASILLLIQHTDNRSKLTIPYKTWDYLNSGKPIFALINNHELAELLIKHGHYVSNINDINDIKNTYDKLIDDIAHNILKIKKNQYNIVEQVKIFID